MKGFNPTLCRDLNSRQSALQPHECDLAFFSLRHRLTVFYHQLNSMFSLLLYEPIINKRQKCVYEQKDTLVWGLAIPNFIAGKRNKPYKQLSRGGRKRNASKRCILGQPTYFNHTLWIENVWPCFCSVLSWIQGERYFWRIWVSFAGFRFL